VTVPAPPLAELYDLLRAEGFAIGVDDHVRIGRLLACDAAWTSELLRTAVAALVVTDLDERDAFDACWARWMGGEPARRVAPVAPAAQAAPAIHRERSPAASSPSSELPHQAGAQRRRAMVVAAAAAVVVAVVLALRSTSGPAPQLPESEAVQQPVGSGSGPGQQPGPIGSGQPQGSADAGPQTPPSDAHDLASIPIAIGAIVLAILAIAGMRGARGRRRFLPGPWRYVVAVPPAVRPVLPRRAVEDAAADLTSRAPGAGWELDVARSIAATVACGGLPTLVHRTQAAAPRYLVLEDTAGGAGHWQPIYDELWSGLAREGVEIERYRFTANPQRCVRPDGCAVELGELIDHADALIVIGDGDAAVGPLDGRRAGWLALLRRIPRRLWINPVPPVRWSAGARAIAEDTPMEHGVARAVAVLHAGGERRGHRARPYPGGIERAPDTASAVAGLRAALGDPAFHLVSAVAVTAPPTLVAARWLAEVLALQIDEQDWLAVATLPWFRAGAWPDGLRDRLAQALAAGAPDLAGRSRRWPMIGSQRANHQTAPRPISPGSSRGPRARRAAVSASLPIDRCAGSPRRRSPIRRTARASRSVCPTVHAGRAAGPSCSEWPWWSRRGRTASWRRFGDPRPRWNARRTWSRCPRGRSGWVAQPGRATTTSTRRKT
jgi:hypothetical protein